MKKKVNSRAIKLILKLQKKNPDLGVRKLSGLLKGKHGILLSKSTVASIIKEKGIKLERGRKPAHLLYGQKEVADCGLILLSCVDSQIGLIDYLTEEIRVYLPRLSKSLIRKFIVLSSFSYFSGGSLKENVEKTGFLRLADLNSFPAKQFNYFKNMIVKYKPVIDLGPVKENLAYISTVKFIFNNGNCGFCDAQMSTFWDGVCKVSNFFLLKQAAHNQINKMLKERLIVVGYTQSFGNLSALAVNFCKGIESGIDRLEFLNKAGNPVSALDCSRIKSSYAIGYSPKVLNQGIKILGRTEKERKIAWDELGGFYCRKFVCEFLQHSDEKGVMLGNVRMRQNRNVASSWGLLVPAKKDKIEDLVKNYLYRFKGMEALFKRDLKIIEESLLSVSMQPELTDIFPKRLKFRDISDFAWLTQILSSSFKEIVGGWEPRGKKGNFSKGKTYLKVFLEKVPLKIRQKFNESPFYYENKRVFLG